MRQIMFVFIFLFTMAGAASSESQEPSKKAKGTELEANLTNSLDMQFVKIPAGELQMGITENDAARLIQSRLVDWPLRDWKKKVHKVTLTMDYYIGKHEVTVGQFRKFVEATNYYTNAEDGFNAVRTTVIEGAITAGNWRDPKFKQGEDHPVVCVTSVDAQKFIDWLNKTDKKKPERWEYRLPTEAEWEYAALGSKWTKFPWGNEWKEGCCQPAPEGLCFNLFKPEFLEFRTLPVGSFSPKGDSPFGVCDMSGNVSEWCLDWYEDNYPKKDQPDPLGPVPGTISRNGIYASPYTTDEESDLRIQQTMKSRVFKGDSWYDEQRFMSIAQRRYHPYGQKSYIGFRVALAPIVPDRKWPAARAVRPQPGVDVMAPTKSSRERLAAFKADDAVTEELYKEIVAADQMGILVSLEKKPERAIAKYDALMEDLSHRTSRFNRSDAQQRPPTVGELGLLLLAGTDPRMPKSNAYEKGFSTIKDCTEIVLDEMKPRRLLLRQLIKSWMSIWISGKKEFITLAQFYELKEVASKLAAMAVAPNTKPEIRFNCLYTLINLGGQPELESLAPLFENRELVPETLFRRAPEWVENRVPQQWRDLALLVMIRIARCETEEFGFSQAKADTIPSRYDMDLAFLNEAARKTAFKKWQAREKNLPRPAPKADELNKDIKAPQFIEPQKDVGKLPKLPGKAPVFCVVTKVDKASETFNYFLLYDEIVNTEKIVEDEKGVVKKKTSNSLMTNRNEEKTGRSLKGMVISNGNGMIIPLKQAMEELPGKLVFFCDDFEGLHPIYRKMLAEGTWIIEIEKPKGLRVESPLAAMKEPSKDMPTPKRHMADLGGGMKMELVLIPAGKFKMGSGESAKDTAAFFNKTYRENFPADGGGGLEEDFFKNEHPQHDVSITKPFFMGMHHVTRGQFKQFVADTAYKTDTEKDKKLLAWGWDSNKKQFSNDKKYSWQNTGFKQTDEHPVVNVTWNDAVAFCKWLSKKEGQNYRLPTEAEWEYACRAGTTTRYPTGDDPKSIGKVGELADLTDVAVRAKIPDWKYMIRGNDNYVFTSPVGKSKPNAFGLYDMHGNAFQWCEDWYGDKYYAASPTDNPSGPNSGTERVIRGGTWNFRPLGARSAERNKTEPDSRNCSAGFRVVRTQ